MKGLSFFLMFIIITFSSVNIAETRVYKWIDSDGKTHFSDKARPGTPMVTVTTNNLFSNDDVFPEQDEEQTNQTEKSKKPPIIYNASITSPKNDASVRSNNGLVVVQVSTTPKLEANHKLQLYVDSEKKEEPQSSTTIRVQNMDRGTHQLQVQILDEKGKTTAETEAISFHLLRATVKKQIPAISIQ
jgi:hypothetical protein